jgi:hypothetical protein
MEQKNELYLVVLSILLGISVLKITEVFQFAEQVKSLLINVTPDKLSATTIAIAFFIAGYFIFFVLTALASFGIVNQLRNPPPSEIVDMGPLVGMCVIALAISYLIVFAVCVFGILGR